MWLIRRHSLRFVWWSSMPDLATSSLWRFCWNLNFELKKLSAHRNWPVVRSFKESVTRDAFDGPKMPSSAALLHTGEYTALLNLDSKFQISSISHNIPDLWLIKIRTIPLRLWPAHLRQGARVPSPTGRHSRLFFCRPLAIDLMRSVD